MSVFLYTLLFAAILSVLAGLGIGIGRLLTGTSKFSCKRCGTPEKDEKCQICKKPRCKDKK